ncbi:MAG TPA: SDR family oxidoreductase [Acidimicrobiales bacterium]|jgi:7-alpha-hydroxysteroid dehydrogenase|nr:SDR family oxidoreductase [Acidimicrobiales bacterium]
MILDRFKVTDQVAIVTGSGRGIGAASAVALAEAGADIVLAARTEEQLREVARRVEATGRRAAVVAGDLTDVELMGSLADTAHQAFGRVDIVVNNLGGTMPRPLLDTSPRALEEAFHFNVGAGHALVRAAVPLMLEGEAPGGAIVNISSVMGHVGARGYLAYGTVKGALEQYTRLAARDLCPRIRVNAVAVGSTATSALDIVMSSDELRTQMEEATPLKRIGDPEDIAATVLFLASSAGSFITGKIIEADGGLQSANLEFGLPDL